MADLVQRVTDDVGGGDVVIEQLIDEGTVGAVFQKPPDEIGQKITMGADRGVNPAGITLFFPDQPMQRFAHAVQTLKLKGLVRTPRERHDRRHCMGVVGGKLRIKMLTPCKQLLCAGQVGKVCASFAGENGVGLKPHDLGPLDLGIPVGAFDQTDHDAPLSAFCEGIEPVNDRCGIQVIRLHHHAKALPVGECRLIQERLDNVQGQVEPLTLLGIDVKAHRGTSRELRKCANPAQEFRHDPPAFPMLKARVQCRQLDRDSGVLTDGCRRAARRKRRDCLGVRQVIAPGIGV